MKKPGRSEGLFKKAPSPLGLKKVGILGPARRIERIV